MVGESDGGKGCNFGGQDKDWMGSLKEEPQPRRSSVCGAAAAQRYDRFHNNPHITYHALPVVYDARPARGGRWVFLWGTGKGIDGRSWSLARLARGSCVVVQAMVCMLATFQQEHTSRVSYEEEEEG